MTGAGDEIAFPRSERLCARGFAEGKCSTRRAFEPRSGLSYRFRASRVAPTQRERVTRLPSLVRKGYAQEGSPKESASAPGVRTAFSSLLSISRFARGSNHYPSLSRNPNPEGAGDETRTRDINLGKVALYQLSYTRMKQ